jgi:hypothetical protein
MKKNPSYAIVQHYACKIEAEKKTNVRLILKPHFYFIFFLLSVSRRRDRSSECVTNIP